METIITLYTSGRKEDLTDFDNLRKLIYTTRPSSNYQFRVIDVFKYPETAKQEEIVVLPTIICRSSNQSSRKITGKIKDPERLIDLLGLSNDYNQSQDNGEHSYPMRVLQGESKGPGGFYL